MALSEAKGMAPLAIVSIAALCTCTAIVLALWHIYMHLKHYTEPTYQRYTVRIIFMVPVYALMSFLSLVIIENSVYYNSIRDIYEAFVIYTFLSLCLAWVGGPGAVVQNLSGRTLKPSLHLMTCCFPAIPLDGRFIRRCKQGGLQFVILKPILVAATFMLYARNKYEDGNFSAKQGYLYITLVYTVSYSLALYALVLFYVACKDLLRPFKPVRKFVMIKSVVFLTYWQGLLVFLAAKSGLIADADEAANVQNFIICIEMAAAAIGHLFAFPYKEYAEVKGGGLGSLTRSITHALNLFDVVSDTVHQFAPTYHDYVLYDGSQGATKKYGGQTLTPTGQEMDTFEKDDKILGTGKLDETTLTGFFSESGSSSTDFSKRVEKAGNSQTSSLYLDSQLTSEPDTFSLLDAPITFQSTITDVPSRSSREIAMAESSALNLESRQYASSGGILTGTGERVLGRAFLSPTKEKAHALDLGEIEIDLEQNRSNKSFAMQRLS
ncbi:hypothetical protein O6H91_11G012000 [Diphasiastrum complanatum]|uniref:Uncharacterized protein n=2 Tax=Diphasiastrum complanatum TaxID=34168 RepID=A0ACC2C6G2_DIPCM|nr:hypothetical protein O6H91_11G012000 [Diphasiastrum complanatum]KAJ7537571.1 hypothetical protein O6H91_11G012000 [Diphasiastrum complanatum]